MRARVQVALEELADCRACPRDCGVNRLVGQTKTCNTGRHAVVAAAYPHRGEEACLQGTGGSGAVFFGLCNLRCVFCQNWDISQKRNGWEAPAEQLAATMLELQEQGCHNINLITPEHVVPQIVEALALAAAAGLSIPIVYNTSGYDALSSLKLLDGLVDVYLPDFKFWSPRSARDLARAKDYPHHARAAIREMHRQVGVLRFGADGLARRGVLLRHLVMPGHGDEAAEILRWIAREVSADTYVNLMGQYRPDHLVGQTGKKGERRFVQIGRRPHHDELEHARRVAVEAGLWRFDGSTASVS